MFLTYSWLLYICVIMPYILNIETATEICSIGLSDGANTISLKESEAPYSHSGQITLLIQQCLADVGFNLQTLDAVAISRGPGSFTALRIGIATAKGICYSLNKPLLVVDTLQAIALGCFEKEQKEALYCPMIDARRMEVYTALFNHDNVLLEEAKALIVTEKAFETQVQNEQSIIFCGNGAAKCQAVLNSPYFHFSPTVCSAAHLPKLSLKAFEAKQFADLAYFEPFYLKSPNITTPKKLLNR